MGDSARSGTPNAGTDDLRALMAVYSPGLAIELELEAVLATPDGEATKCGAKSINPEGVDGACDAKKDREGSGRVGNAVTGPPAQMEMNEFGSTEAHSAKVESDGQPVSEKKLDRLLSECGTAADKERGVRNSAATRIEPIVKSCSFVDETGILRTGIVVNVSQFDALIKTTHVPRLASQIVFSGSPKRTAEITRNFEIGFVAKFSIPLADEEFSDAIQFTNSV